MPLQDTMYTAKGSFLMYDKMPCLVFNGTELTCPNSAFAFPVSALAKQVVDSLYVTKNGGITSQSVTQDRDFFQNVVNYDRFSPLRQWKLFAFATMEAFHLCDSGSEISAMIQKQTRIETKERLKQVFVLT